MESSPVTPHARPASYLVIELLMDTSGLRYDGQRGDRRRIRYHGKTPDIVARCRAGRPIDWGGAMVPGIGYRVVYDGPYSPTMPAA